MRASQMGSPAHTAHCAVFSPMPMLAQSRFPCKQSHPFRAAPVKPHRIQAGRCWSQKMDIPIFPLNMVAYPSAAVPLHIFEARYRVLFNTLLQGAEGLEEGLIQDSSPFAGSRVFGMCWTDSKGAIAAIGTTLEINSHVMLEDGRMGIESIGKERFKIVSVKQEKPVLVCEVELLEEEDDSSPELRAQADEVRDLFRTLIQLHAKKGTVKPEDAAQYEPEELRTLGPRNLSFWVASNFRETPQQQQILLQENSTAQRLEYEKKVLEGSVGYLRAKLAVEAALRPDAAGSSEEQPPTEGSTS